MFFKFTLDFFSHVEIRNCTADKSAKRIRYNNLGGKIEGGWPVTFKKTAYL